MLAREFRADRRCLRNWGYDMKKIGVTCILASFGLIFYTVMMEKSQVGLSAFEVMMLVSDFTLFFGGLGLVFWASKKETRSRAIKILIPFCGILVTGGIFFKIFHLPTASIQLILGVFMFSFIVGPIIARQRYEKWKDLTHSKAKLLAIMLTDSAGFALIGLGLTFWIQHWPGAMVIVFIGLLLLVGSAVLWNNSIDLLFRIQLKTSADLRFVNEQLEEKSNEITDSIKYAKRIQEAILPPVKLVKEHLEQSFILYKPKDIVAGDFYWMESVGDVVYFAAADCTGHGVPGAMVSVICNNGLNRSVREFCLRKPSEILNKTRELVIQEFEKSEEEVKDGMDISLCALNTKTNELEWAGANNPLWIVSSNVGQVARSFPDQASDSSFETSDLLFEVKANKQPIGKYGLETPFTNHSIQLEKGDTIYIFSDGYPDQFGGENGKKYKSGNFKKTLVRLSKETIEKQKQMLDQEFESWRGSIEQIDDVCVIGVRV